MSRRWCITVNNIQYEYLDCTKLAEWTYSIYGNEKAPTTGTPHVQGYIIFKKNQRLSAVKKMIPTAHWEIAKGSTEQNIAYCSKDGEFEEFGERPKTKKEIGDDERIRWKNIIAMAKAGTLEENEPKIYYQTYKTAEALKTRYMAAPAIEKEVKVFWGPTGTGKSKLAWEEAGMDAFPKDPRTKFWNGYNEQKNVILDEFRGGIDIAHMLRWLDRYPSIVEVKGSSTPLMAEKIWITSNLHPKDWYPELDQETQKALIRRLKITEFKTFK